MQDKLILDDNFRIFEKRFRGSKSYWILTNNKGALISIRTDKEKILKRYEEIKGDRNYYE